MMPPSNDARSLSLDPPRRQLVRHEVAVRHQVAKTRPTLRNRVPDRHCDWNVFERAPDVTIPVRFDDQTTSTIMMSGDALGRAIDSAAIGMESRS